MAKSTPSTIRRINSSDLISVEKEVALKQNQRTEADDITNSTDLCMSVDLDSESSAETQDETARLLEQQNCATEPFAENAFGGREDPADTSETGEAMNERKDNFLTALELEELNEGLESSNGKAVRPESPKSVASVLKRSISDPELFRNDRGAWKVLPKPDLEKLIGNSYASAETSTAKRQKGKHSVAFTTINIRCYEQTVGDNPSVSYGPPIQLDWKFVEMEPICIDLYEDGRPPRRNLRQMVLSYFQRRNLLHWMYGFSEEEIRAAKKEAKKVKYQRAVTNTFIPVMAVEATFESAGRKAKRIFKRSQSS